MPAKRTIKPKKDPVKAIILERQSAYKKTDAEMAKKLRMCRQTYSKLMHTHTSEWSFGTIVKACEILEISEEELKQAIKY